MGFSAIGKCCHKVRKQYPMCQSLHTMMLSAMLSVRMSSACSDWMSISSTTSCLQRTAERLLRVCLSRSSMPHSNILLQQTGYRTDRQITTWTCRKCTWTSIAIKRGGDHSAVKQHYYQCKNHHITTRHPVRCYYLLMWHYFFNQTSLLNY